MIADLQNLGIDLLGRTSGSIKTLCPSHICRYERRNKKDKSLSVDIDKGIYYCHYPNCGLKGSVYSRAKIKKHYKIPEYNNTQLSDKKLKWLLDRGISKNTILRFKISESSEWMPQTQKIETCLNFNYFRDEKLVNIKFRDGAKNFKMAKDAELIFYGLDLIRDSKVVIITEGELDCMSFYECGFFYSVSVPNGASLGNQKLEFLDNCYENFKNKEKIILATDNDQPGIALREELARRLGKERCFIFQYPDGAKDANDILKSTGPEVLKECINNVVEYPIEGVTTIEAMEDRIDFIFRNGFKQGSKLGYNKFDSLLTWMPGELTSVTGIPGSGKSEFIDQILIKLSLNDGWKFGIFSPENHPEEYHFSKLAEKYIGKTFHGNCFKMDEDDLFNAKSFLNESFYFIDINDENISLDGLLKKVRELVLRKGINGFLLDPWNYIEHKIPQGYSETQYISEALTKLSRFAKSNQVHIIVVAHPVKIQKDPKTEKYKIPTMYDISGSAHWFNKTDNGISIYRDFDTNLITAYVQKVRFKFTGQIGFSSFTWEKTTGRYVETT